MIGPCSPDSRASASTLKIFLSYASEQRPIAEPLALALEAEGHEVFFDRHDLPIGDSFHDRIRDAIDNADRCVFLISPQSVEPGSYALTELALTQARWPRPAGRVLPVMAADTLFDRLPAYLGAVTVLQPKGNLAAEVAAHFAAVPWWRRRLLPVAAATMLGAAAIGTWTWRQHVNEQEQARLRAEKDRLAREEAAAQVYLKEIEAASALCASASYAPAWENFEEAHERAPSPATRSAAQSAQADCGMAWLRDLSVRDSQRFTTFTDKIVPVIGREIAVSQGTRLADLHAHIGWADYLRWRDGTQTQPSVHYQRAIAIDARNPFANAMWAHNSTLKRDADAATVAERFETALASGRETAFVRFMQTVLVDIQGDQLVPVLRSLAEGRKRGEPAPRGRERLYRRWCEWDIMGAAARGALLESMSADDARATIAWLQPVESLPADRQHLWRLCGSAYLVHAGRFDEADTIIRDTLRAMGKPYEGGNVERWAKEQLARFKPAR